MRTQKRFFPKQKSLFAFFSTTILTLIGGMVIFVFFGTATASAINGIDAKQDQIEEINKKIQTYKDMTALKQKEQDYLNSQIQTLDTQAEKIQNDIDAKKNTLNSLNDQIRTLEGKISEKTDLIERQKKILAELLRMYYSQRDSLNPSTNNTFLIGSAEEVNADNRVSDWTSDLGTKVSDLAESITALRQSLLDEQKKLNDDKSQVESARFQLEQQNQYLDSAKQTKLVSVQKAQIAEKQYKNIISDLQKEREDIEQEIERLEQAKIDQLDVSKLPGFGSKLFIYPVTKPKQSQGYGKTSFAKKAYASGFHNGVDFADSTGTPIYAAASGTVIGVGNCGRYAYGKWVAIDHGNGLVTLYGHLSKQSVSKGQSVSQGKQIGLMGSTGYSTGSHVHFTVFAKSSFDVVESKSVSGIMIPTGATVNPKNYLP